MLSAILYAEYSGRNLHVMWDDGLYGPEGENVFPRLFELREVARTHLDLDHPYSSRPAFWRGELRQPMKVLYRRCGPEEWNRRWMIEQFSFDQTRLDYNEEVLVMWEFDQFGNCCEPRITWMDHRFIGVLAQRHLAPARVLQEMVDRFTKERFLPVMIGVHVRQSNEEGSRIKQVEESRYHDLIRRIRRRTPEVGLFLATDNAGVEAHFRDLYGDAVVTTDKWFAAAGKPLHLANGRPDRLRNAIEALMDMFLLATCDHLIFPAWSSFSLTASYFSRAADENLHPLKMSLGLHGHIDRLKRLLPL